jgi:acyl dehydratase
VRYWEDFSAGDVFDLGSRIVTREEMVAFASQWDPQGFHLDEEAGRATVYGGLIASGWHTASLCMRLYVDALLHDAASLGSPGMSEVSWPAPVRPGDRISARIHVVDSSPSSKHSDRGWLLLRWEAVNQDDQMVLVMVGRGLFRRRPQSPSRSDAKA